MTHTVRGGHEESINLLLLERDIKDGEDKTAEDVASILPEELSSYQITGRLGKGAFGTVFSAWSEEHGNFALKAVEYEGKEMQVIESLRREMETIPSLNHPNVLRYHRVHDDAISDTAYIAMEWCPGTLFDEARRRRERGEPFRDDEVWKYLREMAAGLACLHERGLVHRDLKPGNVFLAYDGHCVLGDFGLVRDAARSRQMSTVAGTELYMAPELYEPEPYYSFPVDVWALGVVGYELCTYSLPFRNMAAVLEETPAPQSLLTSSPGCSRTPETVQQHKKSLRRRGDVSE